MPVVAAATAAVVRTFFGEAMRRMTETDTENLFFGDGGAPVRRDHTLVAGAYSGAEAREGTSAPGDSSRETGLRGVRNDPFY
jgi:hypothetical protein